MRDYPSGFRLYAEVVLRLFADQCRLRGDKLQGRCPFRDRHRNGDRNWSAVAVVGDSGALLVGCSGCGAQWAEFVAFSGLPATAFFPPKPFERRCRVSYGVKRVPVAKYPYRDRGGDLLAVKVRLEPGYDGRPKDFLWRRPVPGDMARFFGLDPAKPAWANSLRDGYYGLHRTDADGTAWFGPQLDRADRKSYHLPTCEPGLYRLPELLAADPKAPAFVVESEKNAETLRALGFVATCGHAGATLWGDHWAEHLAGRRVVLVPDRDPSCVGVRWACKVAASAILWRAESVRLVMLPVEQLKPDGTGGGVEDWLCRYFGAPKTLTPALPVKDARAAVVGLVTRHAEVPVGRLWGERPAGGGEAA